MQKTYKITNEDGIHARPATALVNTASKFKSEVFAEANNRKVTMKSILGVLSFGLEPGDLVTFIAEGEDASDVLEALDEIFAKESIGIAHA
ncbi:phosphocarrier protein HPr [Paenibacillus sp. J23TS9]|uniref:Phosphocarrier protein HPr n=1 Tax=Paenibacillus dokdonensis TaxID=2567944 RepID=A0ABU6GNS2_9BACL|nr:MULTISPECIES: HPr family phosphocarrier protein [Paenibacillus]MEC0239797.1 HPr family phosphocarrier protein [Paenibacillus dokdonensis]GIP30354.1 phosphocarrier protein HPr [Paenibacillus sp. J23TS9]